MRNQAVMRAALDAPATGQVVDRQDSRRFEVPQMT
jgi:hypothetical protein